jgi:hypothetical protein
MSSISSGPCWATRTAVAHHLSARRYAPHGPVWPSRPRSPAPAAVDRPFDPRPRSATSVLSRNSPFQPAEPQWGPLSTEYCTPRVNPLPSADETAVSPCTLGLVSHAIPVCPVSATITHPRLGTHPPSEVTFPVGCQDPIRLWASQEVTPPELVALHLHEGMVPQSWSIYPTESTAFRHGWNIGTPHPGGFHLGGGRSQWHT